MFWAVTALSSAVTGYLLRPMPNDAISCPDALIVMMLDTAPVGEPFCVVDDVAEAAE